MRKRYIIRSTIRRPNAAPHGKHWLIDLGGCDASVLAHQAKIKKILLSAAKVMGAGVVTSVFHSFNPVGISGVVVIKESHLTIHTWPEHGFASIDFFTCGESIDMKKGVALIEKRLKSKRRRLYILKRLPPGLKSLVSGRQTSP